MFKTRIAVQKKKQKHTHRSNEMQNKINLVSSIKKNLKKDNKILKSLISKTTGNMYVKLSVF